MPLGFSLEALEGCQAQITRFDAMYALVLTGIAQKDGEIIRPNRQKEQSIPAKGQ
jgi:hypothetical protein